MRQARKRRGLLLRHVARHLGVTVPLVHAYEFGEVHIPVLRFLELADFVGLDTGLLSRRRILRERAAA